MEFKLKSFKKSIDVSKIANIHYFEFTKEYHTFKDKHPFRELVYVDNGCISVDAENYSGILDKNQLIIHKANEVHSLTCPPHDAPSVIIIGFECRCEKLDEFSRNPHSLSAEQQSLLSDIIREGRNVFLPPYDVPNLKNMKKRKKCIFGADQMIKLKMETFFIDLIRTCESVPERVLSNVCDNLMLEIKKYIDNHFNETITLNDLCFLYGLNKTTLCGRFKTAFGNTVINYINYRRIKEAKRLMREGSRNLTQISAAVGFSSVHYFSRSFKRYENKSPSEYIKTIKARLMM